MTLFDTIERLFQDVRDYNECTKALVTVFTATGALLILLCLIKIAYDLFTGFRLYIWSQFCSSTDYRKRYGQWAVISGATDGIGLAMAKELAGRGHSIVAIGIYDDELASTKVLLEGIPNVGDVLVIKTDLSDSSIENFEKLRERIDPDNKDIGILINNVGIFPTKVSRYNHYDMKYIRTMINLHIMSTLYLTRMIMPGMIERERGLVLNLSSMAGSYPWLYGCVYGPAKAFVNAFSRHLQIEYSSHPVDIVYLTPGFVSTNLIRNISTITGPSLFFPSPDDFVKSVLNAVSARVNTLCGTIPHAISLKLGLICDQLGILKNIFDFSERFMKDINISPVMRRKTKNRKH